MIWRSWVRTPQGHFLTKFMLFCVTLNLSDNLTEMHQISLSWKTRFLIHTLVILTWIYSKLSCIIVLNVGADLLLTGVIHCQLIFIFSSIPFITAYVPRTREGNVFSRACACRTKHCAMYPMMYTPLSFRKDQPILSSLGTGLLVRIQEAQPMSLPHCK